jgi:L-ascorbate metabolism protein UlaG (beta-lactamase superfamily)
MTKLARAQKSGRKFLNPVPTTVGGLSLMLKIAPLYLQSLMGRSREETEPATPLGPFPTNASLYEQPPESGLRVTWFGHSSMLIEIDGVRLLMDPVWDERASPSSWFGPKRFFPPTLPLAELPELDAVLLSHDHYDHLGRDTVAELARLRPGLRWICPLAVGAVLQGFGIAAGQITELDWTESMRIGELMVTAIPSRHFSGRSLRNRFETLWTSWVLTGPRHTVYFGADSGLWDGFAAIAQEYGPFDLTMLEIGAFHPLWADIHLGPDGAAEAFRRLGGGVLLPMHWGLFNLALHAWRQPVERIEELAAERNIQLFLPKPGEPTEFRGAGVSSGWWKKG